MADDPIAIARVGLARALPRILLLPLVLVVLAGASVGAGFVAPMGVDLALWAVAGVLVGAAFVVSIIPLTLRLEVEVGGLRVRWLAGSRRYRLVPGAVTRATMARSGQSAIRTRFGFLGWAYGRAILRGEEPISIVRLAPTSTVILVPTDRGRLAIGASSEPELLEALGAAARVQQRLDEVSGRLLAVLPGEGEPAERGLPARAEGAPADEGGHGDAAPPGGPRILTGIERARLEAELAAARHAALEAAEAERQSIAEARMAGEALQGAARREEPRVPREPEEEVEVPWSAPGPARRRARGTWTRPGWATDRRLAVLAAIGWALVPLAASLAAYLITGGEAAIASGDTTARLEALALVACGPLAALGILAARAWWPRLTGLVTVSALSALVLLGRAVMG
jgi:hypothetical protein